MLILNQKQCDLYAFKETHTFPTHPVAPTSIKTHLNALNAHNPSSHRCMTLCTFVAPHRSRTQRGWLRPDVTLWQPACDLKAGNSANQAN